MTMQMPDRLFVQEVLSGKHRSEKIGPETPVIRELESQEWPELASSNMPWLAGVALIVFFTTSFFLLNQVLESEVPISILMLLGILVFVMSWTLSFHRERRIRSFDQLMQEACLELGTLVDEQKELLIRLDERMVKYFNSNTISDSYILFILMQLRDLMERRLEKVCVLLSKPTRDNLLFAHRLFFTPLSVRESVIEGLGRVHPIPISHVRETAGPLLEYVQENLLALEAEAAEMDEEFKQTDEDGFKAA